MVGGYKVNLPTATTTNKKNNSNKTITPVAVDTSYGGNMSTLLATPTFTPPTAIPVATPTVKPINAGSYFDSGVVGTVGGLTGGGSNRGATDEGVIIGNPSVNNSTFNNIDTSYGGNAVYTGAEPIKNITPKTPVATTYAANLGNTQESTPTVEKGGNAAAEKPAETPAPTETETVDTYEQFLINQGKGYQDRLDKTTAAIAENKQAAIDLANKQRAEAEQKAESERQRGVIDARSSYEQNKATYGANAEMLASMGLTGGGHSDYIDSQAYAMQRAETQAANAQAEAAKQDAKYKADTAILGAEQQAASDKLAAELTYAENMAANDKELAQYKQQKADEATEKEEQKKSYYAALLTSANTGEYTSEQLATLGAQYGLSEEQIAQLQTAANDYETDQKNETYNTTYAQALQNITDYGADLDSDYLDNLLEMDLISQEQYNTLMSKYQSSKGDSVADDIQTNIESGDTTAIEANLSNADQLYAEKKITTEQYQKIYATEQSGAVDKVLNGSYTSISASHKAYKDAYAKLDEYKAAGKLSDSEYRKLKARLDSTSSNTCTGGWFVEGLGSGRENDDIDITIGSTSRKGNGAKEYDLLCGAEVTDGDVKKALNKLATGDENKTPAVEGGWTWLHGDEAVSSKQKGKLVVYCNQMFIYTSSGWRVVKNDNDDIIADAIKAYLGK